MMSTSPTEDLRLCGDLEGEECVLLLVLGVPTNFKLLANEEAKTCVCEGGETERERDREREGGGV